jgi:hypothetical protein
MTPIQSILCFLLICSPLSSQAADLWWNYMARYDNGIGTTDVNLTLYKKVPLADYPYLVTTGTRYPTSFISNNPSKADIARFKQQDQQVLAAITAISPGIHAGGFTYDGEHRLYVYVQRPDGIDAALKQLYTKICVECKSFTRIKEDKTWAGYKKFIYPNPQTREFYKKRLEKMGFKHE